MIPELDFQALANIRSKGLFSDITVVAPQGNVTEFKLHKVILAASSKYFEDVLSKDPAVDKITLPEPVNPQTWKHPNWQQAYEAVLEGLYSSDCMKELTKHGLSPENCFAYSSVAKSLQLKSMALHISDYIAHKVMDQSTLTSVLVEATKQEMPDIIEKCYSVMLQDFCSVLKNNEQRDNLLKLPFDKFLALVSRDDMVVDSEDTVFDLVIKYITFREQHLHEAEKDTKPEAPKITDPGAPPAEGEKPPQEKPAENEPAPEAALAIPGDVFSPSMFAEEMMKIMPLSDDQKKSLLLSLRYQYISHEKLMKESRNSILLPFRDLLMEGLSAKLKSHEPSSLTFQINMKPRMYYGSAMDLAGNIGDFNEAQANRANQGLHGILPGIGNKMANVGDQYRYQQQVKDNVGNFVRGKLAGEQVGNQQGMGMSSLVGKGLMKSYLDQQKGIQHQAGLQKSTPFDSNTLPPGFLDQNRNNSHLQNQMNPVQSRGFPSSSMYEAESRARLGAPQHLRADPSGPGLKPNYQLPPGFHDNYNQEGAYIQDDDEDLLFTYRYDFDENGALFYLGTQGKTTGYMNPYNLNLVKVFFSSMGKGSYEDFVGRSLVNCRTLNEPNAFMGIDFGQDRYLVPSCYTIRNRDSSRHIMLNWLFEGSIDFKTWFVLDKRIHKTDDPAYNKMLEKERQMVERRGATSTWSIDQNYLKVASRSIVMQSKAFNGFRYFRIKQISKNSSGADNLALSGFEIYGIAKGMNWRFI